MTIYAKFEIEEVFYMSKNTVQSGVIDSISTFTSKEPCKPSGYKVVTHVNYTINDRLSNTQIVLNEKFLFPSKEELLKSL